MPSMIQGLEREIGGIQATAMTGRAPLCMVPGVDHARWVAKSSCASLCYPTIPHIGIEFFRAIAHLALASASICRGSIGWTIGSPQRGLRIGGQGYQ